MGLLASSKNMKFPATLERGSREIPWLGMSALRLKRPWTAPREVGLTQTLRGLRRKPGLQCRRAVLLPVAASRSRLWLPLQLPQTNLDSQNLQLLKSHVLNPQQHRREHLRGRYKHHCVDRQVWLKEEFM